MQALMQSQKQANPAQNPATPNTRVSANDKFLERIKSAKALLQAIKTDSPHDDPLMMDVVDVIVNTFTTMLLNAAAVHVVQGMVQKVGERLAPLAAGGGAPLLAGPPVPAQAPMGPPGAPPGMPSPGAMPPPMPPTG